MAKSVAAPKKRVTTPKKDRNTSAPVTPWKGVPYSDVSGSLDPRSVYVSRAMSQRSKAKPGLERFAYEVFGPQFIGSLAFALDPYSEIRFPTSKITPTNRTVNIPCVPLTPRKGYDYTRRTDCDTWPDTSTPDVQDTIGPFCVSSYSQGVTGSFVSQPYIKGVRSDTTVRTRPLDSKGGEFELFAPFTRYPARSWSDYAEIRVYVQPNNPVYKQVAEDFITRGSVGLGPGAYVSQSEIDKYLTFERSEFSALRAKYALGMVRDAVPSSREISVARNIGELKDLPLLLRRSVELYRDPALLLEFKGQGNQYLNYKFGWDATYRAVRDMMKIPEQISKEVNYLIERNGFSSNFRSKRKGVSSITNIPGVNHNFYSRETFVSGAYVTRRSWELRLVLNYTLQFPKIDIPALREELLAAKWGLYPKPEDVYELVPWTWLVDWFGGLGEYIDVMNTLMRDPNLFNYGYLTYRSDGEATSTVRIKRRNVTTMVTSNPNSSSDSSYDVFQNYCGSTGYAYQRRVDISGQAGVKAISRPSTLSADQTAIIGALLTKFAHS